MKKAFLICPVRGHDKESTQDLVDSIEEKGYTVHWPFRDTNQDDPVGLHICEQNFAAIEASDIVFVVWDGKSQGSLFDLGMAFALEKPIRVIKAPPKTEGKSFQNMMYAWELESMV